MYGVLQDIAIKGMAVAVPEYVENNEAYEEILGKRRLKKQLLLTGVTQRHISGKYQHTADLCYSAASKLISHLKWERDDIKILVLVTQSPTFKIPSTAFWLQHKLCLPKDCVVFDVNLGCSSFNKGIQIIGSLLSELPEGKKALLLTGDTSGRFIEPGETRNPDVAADRMLFGSAGSATALQKEKGENILFQNFSNGDHYQAIMGFSKKSMQMDGEKVFEFAINDVADSVNEFKDKFELCESDIDYYVFHQAQKLVLDNIQTICNIAEEKELRSVEGFGNTSGTSVPVSVCANKEKFEDEKDYNVLFTGFGVGLSWGSVYARIKGKDILPIIETNEFDKVNKEERRGLYNKTYLVIGADTKIGVFLSQYLDDKSAHVICYGKDKARMNDNQADFFYDSIVATQVDEIKECASDWKIDGCIICNSEYDSEIIRLLMETKNITEDTPIVCLEDVSKEVDKSKWRDITHNTIRYDDRNIQTVQISGSGEQWAKELLTSGKSEEMNRALSVAKMTIYLLRENKYIRNNVLTIS